LMTTEFLLDLFSPCCPSFDFQSGGSKMSLQVHMQFYARDFAAGTDLRREFSHSIAIC
jgi:hypothetical protein